MWGTAFVEQNHKQFGQLCFSQNSFGYHDSVSPFIVWQWCFHSSKLDIVKISTFVTSIISFLYMLVWIMYYILLFTSILLCCMNNIYHLDILPLPELLLLLLLFFVFFFSSLVRSNIHLIAVVITVLLMHKMLLLW